MLAISQKGGVVRDRYSKGGLESGMAKGLSFGRKVQLPAERVGVAMVYKTFDKISFALIMDATHEIHEATWQVDPELIAISG